MNHPLANISAVCMSVAVAFSPLRLFAEPTPDLLVPAYDSASASLERTRQISNPTLIAQAQVTLTPEQRNLYNDVRSAVRELRDKHNLYATILMIDENSKLAPGIDNRIRMTQAIEQFLQHDDYNLQIVALKMGIAGIALSLVLSQGRTTQEERKAYDKALDAIRIFAWSMSK